MEDRTVEIAKRTVRIASGVEVVQQDDTVYLLSGGYVVGAWKEDKCSFESAEQIFAEHHHRAEQNKVHGDPLRYVKGAANG